MTTIAAMSGKRAVFGVLLALTAAACGDQGATAPPRVATIAGSAQPSASAQPEGVMLRIDMSQKDKEAVYDAYYACLKTNGVAMMRKGPGLKEIPRQQEKDNPAGYRACRAKEPYLDPLLDKTRNPKYADQFRVWLTCMNSHGVEVSGQPDDEFLKFGKRAPGIDGTKYLEIYRQCDMASYTW